MNLNAVDPIGHMSSLAGEKSDAPIVSDSKKKGSFGALAAKPFEGLPERDGNLLQQVVAIAGGIGIAGRQTSESGSVGGEQTIEIPGEFFSIHNVLGSRAG
jgi:hypothetical protein